MKDNQPLFSYAVGRPWDCNDPNSPISIYAYHTEIHHGNMKSAGNFKKYVEEQSPGEEYYIYKLVKVEE